MKDWKIFFLLSLISLFGLTACEDTDEPGEYDNWQERNAEYIDSIAVVARANADGSWKVILDTGLDESKIHGNEYYIYCKVLESGNGTEHPASTDSVQVNYSGHLIPSKSYPNGFKFDSSYEGELEPEFDVPMGFVLSGTVPGFSKAVQNMVAGDIWRVYIPENLGYGAEASSGVPAYSALIFDINLVSFTPVSAVK